MAATPPATADSATENMEPSLTPSVNDSKTPEPDELVPVYCLTKLTDEDIEAFRSDMMSDTEGLDWVKPDFQQWVRDQEGTLRDMYRIWRDTGDGSGYHTAFFIDHDCLSSRSVIVVDPDHETMISSDEASEWARASLSAYLNRKAYPEGVDPWDVPDGNYEDYLEDMADDIVGKRGVAYGRIPATDFNTVWCNLDVANASLTELVSSSGGEIKIQESEDWDEDAAMEKLHRIIREHTERDGEKE